MCKRVLHRDVDKYMYSILTDAEHYDMMGFSSEFKEGKLLVLILDPGRRVTHLSINTSPRRDPDYLTSDENEEDIILVDCDTAADVEVSDVGELLTHRTVSGIDFCCCCSGNAKVYHDRVLLYMLLGRFPAEATWEDQVLNLCDNKFPR